MGAADVVPGVSGGTVALILGIYSRLINAVSHVDRQWLQYLGRRQWKKAWQHIDGALALPLGIGILAGIVLTSFTIHRVLSNDMLRPFALSAFFGMIAASAWLIFRKALQAEHPRPFAESMATILATAAALAISLQSPSSEAINSEPALWYVFVCGAIGICAMLLPGISGAMILLLLGLYGHLTSIPDELRVGEALGANLLTLVVFGCGCLTGILLFSRLLRYMLAHHSRLTMMALCGLMFGSLPRLWPFQVDKTPDIVDFEDKILKPIWPNEFTMESLFVVLAAVLAAGLLFAIHHVTHRSPASKEEAPAA